jgi:two-component system sensor histidine kinase KdpD
MDDFTPSQRSAAPSRGKLRIYFGAGAGVGKTYVMLLAAGKERAAGRQVLLAALHRDDQEELSVLQSGFEVLHSADGGASFDVDAALARRPDVIALDRLACANCESSRHPQRWQDVEELLGAGIDVFTTLNVQDLESLRDVVGDITGARSRDTVPDALFDGADQVILIDVPVDEVLARYQARKVRTADGEAPLRKGHLMALRELALRRTAQRVGDDVLAQRSDEDGAPVWKTGVGLLACIGPGPGSEGLVRSTARLAKELGTGWRAVYVETPRLQRLSPLQHDRVSRSLKLAAELGAATAVLGSQDVAEAIADYARSLNVSKVVCRHSRRRWRFPWNADLAERIADLASDIDIIEIGSESSETVPGGSGNRRASAAALGPQAQPQQQWRRRYTWAMAASLLTAILAWPLTPYLDLANIGLLFLLTVVAVTVRFGRGPSLASAVTAIAAFDFLFVPPRFSFAIYDWQYLVTFIVMFAIAVMTGKLTTDLRYQAAIARQREARSRALYEYARTLSGCLQTVQIFEETRAAIQTVFCARATLLLPDAAGRLQYPEAGARLNVFDMGVAQWAYDHGVPAGLGTDTLPAGELFYLSLVAPMRTRGVLAIEPEDSGWFTLPEQQEHLAAFGTLAAIALERVHYVDIAQDTLVRMESERLRNSLLSALSHDLRTPLTSLVGLSESLTRSTPALTEQQGELAEGLRDEALRMNHLVSNLLDMARIESGNLRLNLQWQTPEEVIGSALHASRMMLSNRDVQLVLAPELPLVRYDAVAIERVLCNLIENAVKYTPSGTRLAVMAEASEGFLRMQVADAGPGLPPGQEEQLFEKFVRGERESAKPGVGLGLSICRAIVEAHRGLIRAYNLAQGGACFEFLLPLGTPPAIPGMEEAIESKIAS